MITAVIFDLDDTLFPERSYAFSGFDAVAAAFSGLLGDPFAVSQEMRALFGTEHRRRIFNTVLTRRNLSDSEELVSAMINSYRTHKPVISLYADADAALKRLRPSYKLGIITDGPAVMQRAKIAALGLAGRVDAMIVTDDLGPGFAKPHPRAFEMMADRCDAVPAGCAYVADNPSKDFAAPNALGWRTIQITRPGGLYAAGLPGDGGTPHHTIDSLDELDGLLEN